MDQLRRPGVRWTLRGVKPCPKCGTYNGTRGFSCKNKSCDAIFKVAEERKKKTTEACRIITDNQAEQIFSVRLRDKGPDYRAFVKVTTDLVDGGDGELTTSKCSQCFVELCPQKNSLDQTQPACHHIQATVNCFSEAEVLPLKSSLIGSLNFSLETRAELWNLTTDQGRDEQGLQALVVQRVSKTIFVVKCSVSEKFPLGFLHCSFMETRGKSGTLERKFNCPCRKAKNGNSGCILIEELPVKEGCIHFHACILAFLSSEKLMNEFSYHIQQSNVLSVALDGLDEISQRQVVVHLEMLPSGVGADDVDILCGDVRVLDHLQVVLQPRDESSSSGFQDSEVASVDSVGCLTLPVGISMSDLLSGQLETTGPVPAQCENQTDLVMQRSGKVRIPALKRPATKALGTTTAPSGATSASDEAGLVSKKVVSCDENATFLLFEYWLASVTERINQSMHYQMSGKPAALVYHIPHEFFECLRARISSSGGAQRKKRLPNTTSVFARKEGPPYAQLTKYSWHLHNPLTVKQIFDTPKVKLEMMRSFVENNDGTYDAFIPKTLESECPALSTAKSGSTLPVLKPLELVTYLKIGQTEGDQSPPIPFILDWIPDLLPQSKFGELRIQFQFGHQRHPTDVERAKRPFGLSPPTATPSLTRRPKKAKSTDKDNNSSSLPSLLLSNDAKDLHNLRLDYIQAPLNDTEFHELTKSVP